MIIKNYFVGQTRYILSSQHSLQFNMINNCLTSNTVKKAVCQHSLNPFFKNKAIQIAQSLRPCLPCKPSFPHLEIRFFLNLHQHMSQTNHIALTAQFHSSKTCLKTPISSAQPSLPPLAFGQLTAASSLAVLLPLLGHDTWCSPLALPLLLLLWMRCLLAGVQGTEKSTTKNTTALCKKTSTTTAAN